MPPSIPPVPPNSYSHHDVVQHYAQLSDRAQELIDEVTEYVKRLINNRNKSLLAQLADSEPPYDADTEPLHYDTFNLNAIEETEDAPQSED